MSTEKKQAVKKVKAHKRIAKGSMKAVEVAITIAKKANLDFSYLKR